MYILSTCPIIVSFLQISLVMSCVEQVEAIDDMAGYRIRRVDGMESRRGEWKCKILEHRGHFPGHSTHWPSSRTSITAVIPGESEFLSIIHWIITWGPRLVDACQNQAIWHRSRSRLYKIVLLGCIWTWVPSLFSVPSINCSFLSRWCNFPFRWFFACLMARWHERMECWKHPFHHWNPNLLRMQ